MRFHVDAWDPSYEGPAPAAERATPDVPDADVVLDVELPPAAWRPLRPKPTATPGPVLFVDGVRRVEARLHIEEPGGALHAGACGSFAAGVLRCAERAVLGAFEVGRGLFSHAATVADVTTRAGTFVAGRVADESPEALWGALQDRMRAAEARLASGARRDHPGELLIVDGPLRGREQLADTVGYVKRHHVSYLPSEVSSILERLAPGERTPVFLIVSSWSRQSWYVRLPGTDAGPWSCVARCEAAAELGPAAAVALADRVTSVLPRFASSPHRDPRAPQNLYPIGGLERELRRRLGDHELIYRALRRAARAAARPETRTTEPAR